MEINPLRTVAFSKNAANVFFHLLTACNLQCRHCYINPSQHGVNTLGLETIADWLSLFVEDKGKTPNIIFLGGEPTLHPELPLAVRCARKLGYQSITIDTNGYLFHDILFRIEPDEVDFISFSLDGASRSVNDSLRGNGAYDACLKGIRQAVYRGFHISLIYTVSSANIHELEQLPALLADLKIQRLFIQVLGIRGKTALGFNDMDSTGIFRVSPEQWLRVIPTVAQQAALKGIYVTYPKVFLRDDEPFECAGKVANNFFIFPNGRVYRCPLCEDYPLHSMVIEQNKLIQTDRINEANLFDLQIPEGCVMNRLVQPDNIRYLPDGSPEYRIACCLLKEDIG